MQVKRVPTKRIRAIVPINGIKDVNEELEARFS